MTNVSEEIRLAGPRLAIKVSQLIKQAFKSTDPPLSQKEIADLMGVSESRISHIVNGDGNVRISTLGRLVEALGLKVEILVTDKNGKPVLVPSRKRKANAGFTSKHHTVQVVGDAGHVATMYSFSAVPVEGKAIDFPLPYSENRKFEENIFSNIFAQEVAVDLEPTPLKGWAFDQSKTQSSELV